MRVNRWGVGVGVTFLIGGVPFLTGWKAVGWVMFVLGVAIIIASVGLRESLTVFERRQLHYKRMERAGPVIAIIDDQMRDLDLCLARLDRGREWLSVLLSSKILLPEYGDAVAQARHVSPEAYQDLNGAGNLLGNFDHVAAGLHEAWNAEGWPHDTDRYMARIREARVFLVNAKQFLTQARAHLSSV